MIPAAHPSRTGLRRSAEDPLAFLEALAAAGGDVVPCTIGRRPAALITAPALIEEVLVRRAAVFVKGRGYVRARRLLGDGLLTLAADRHPARRRQLQPAFHRTQMAGYAATMIAAALRVQARWMPGTALDIAREMQELSLAIASTALFGTDLSGCAAAVRDAVASALPSADGLLAVIAPPFRVRRARQDLERVVDTVIARRVRARRREGDLLDLLLDSSPDGDRRAVRDEAVTFLLAGHDTMAHALTWTWLLLAEHPGADAQMQAELAAVLGARVPEARDLPALAYTRAVFAEALRLRPPAWVIVRQAAGAGAIGGVALPDGALVIVSPWVTHRDERHFREPLTFDPARWTPPVPAQARSAYLPFGAGSRSCIGEHFAWTEGTLVLATIARRWRLQCEEPWTVLPSPRITLRPAGPVIMRPVPR